MKMKQNKSGITLIALIITIIIMLILAAVTISIIVNGGLFDQARNAKEQYEIAAELEKIKIFIADEYISKINESDNEKGYLGTALYDKNVQNAECWNLVIEYTEGNTEIARYGNDWYLIKAGNYIEERIRRNSRRLCSKL